MDKIVDNSSICFSVSQVRQYRIELQRQKESAEKRFEIIKQTYENAVYDGDKNVYLLKGTELMKTAKWDGTVDNVHPNDFGFRSMASALIPIIKEILHT